MHFADCPTYLLEAYADSGEGLDRAGGFAVQVSVFDPSPQFLPYIHSLPSTPLHFI